MWLGYCECEDCPNVSLTAGWGPHDIKQPRVIMRIVIYEHLKLQVFLLPMKTITF